MKIYRVFSSVFSLPSVLSVANVCFLNKEGILR
jgi:hypothetical protein